jgi:hypothetical protein
MLTTHAAFKVGQSAMRPQPMDGLPRNVFSDPLLANRGPMFRKHHRCTD